MTASRRFYTMPISHYCVAVDRMLAFKGLDAERVPVPYHDKTELLRVTDQDFVPALLWDGAVVPWKEIPGFLEAERPTPTLYPEGSGAIATVLQNWGHQVLEERVWRAVVTEVPPTFSDPRERWVFEEMQSRARGPWHVLEQRKAEFEAEALETLALVDAMVQGRPWILREASVADFAIFGSLSPWLTVGRSIPANFPHLAGWVRRIQGLPTAPVPTVAGSRGMRSPRRGRTAPN